MPLVKPHMKPLRFVRKYPPFNAGEVAGFPDAEADALVAAGYATFVGDAPEPEAPEAPVEPTEFLCPAEGCPRGVAGNGYKTAPGLAGHIADKHDPALAPSNAEVTVTVAATNEGEPEPEEPEAPAVALEDLELVDLQEIVIKLEADGKLALDDLDADDKDALIAAIRSAKEADGGTEQPSD